MARRVIEHALRGSPDMTKDPKVQERTKSLVSEAQIILDAIKRLGAGKDADPFCDSHTLATAVSAGILDAPQLKNNPFAKGEIRTKIIDGACVSVAINGTSLTEKMRLDKIY
jgi:hypothetical protein